MNIDRSRLKTGIWYEDENGNRLQPTGECRSAPEGARTYHVIFPLEVTEHVYVCHSAEEKSKCKHRKKFLKKDHDLIKGYKGRMCTSCGCSQTRKWWQPWGRKWDNGADTTPLVDFNTHIGSGNADTIIAMVNSGDYTLSDAIAVYAASCERCMNVLAHKYSGGKDGYAEFSDEWKKANTVCDFCRGE